MVRHFRAASDGERKHIVGVEAKVASASATPGCQVTQRDRSCAGQTTERGTETGLIGCREAVIFNVARFRAPADLLCESGGIGSSAWSNHGLKGVA